MSPDTIEKELIPLAAELIGVVRDYGPEHVAAVLNRVPDGRHDALAVVLAAMVDPDARPSQLLAWTQMGPVASRDGSGFDPTRPLSVCTECCELMAESSLVRHARRMHPETVERAAS